jgi:hypothetical protein
MDDLMGPSLILEELMFESDDSLLISYELGVVPYCKLELLLELLLFVESIFGKAFFSD